MRFEQPEVKRLFGVVLVVVFVEDNEEWIVSELHRPIIRRNTRSINNHRWTMVSACFYLVFCSARVKLQKVKRTSERERVASFTIMLGYACRVIREKFCKR